MASAPSPNTTTPAASTSKPSSPPPPKAFRFKRKRSPSTTSHLDDKPTSHKPSHRRRHHHHHHHHRSRPPSPPSPFHKDPDHAFRESLFDALADDEGAAFWEGVYGQPIHTYSPYYLPTGSAGRNGKGMEAEAQEAHDVQKMTEEEYVRYVREKMWEKSHGYVVEERRRREERRKKGRKAEGREEDKGREWRGGVEEALRRGEGRRRFNRWKGVWERYVEGWEAMDWGAGTGGDAVGKKKGKGKGLRDRIPWPVESGKCADVEKDGVEEFFKMAPPASGSYGEANLGQVLKRERVRWHPDKMQQRAGEEGIDEETLKLATAVFQVVDRLWGELKGNEG